MRRALVVAAVIAAAPAAALPASALAQTEPLRLGEVLRRVSERGPERAVAAAQVEVAASEVRAARMLPNPTVAFAFARVEPVVSGAVQLRLPIFGQRGAHVRAAERGVDQARAEALQAAWHLRHEARLAYYGAARTAEDVAIVVEMEQVAARVADIARARFEAGAGPRLEQDQAALLHARASQDVLDRRSLERLARLELGRQLGADARSLGPLADPLAAVGDTPPLDGLVDAARGRHPELRALGLERDAALARAAAARADVRPVPAVELGADLLTASCSNMVGPCLGPRAGLSFDLPLLNWNGGPVARAEAEAHVAQVKLRAASVRVDAAVRRAFDAFSTALTRARFFDASYVPAAAAVEEMARKGFAAGKTGLLPLLEAERAVLEARLGRVEALYQMQVARADLEEATGVPLTAP